MYSIHTYTNTYIYILHQNTMNYAAKFVEVGGFLKYISIKMCTESLKNVTFEMEFRSSQPS